MSEAPTPEPARLAEPAEPAGVFEVGDVLDDVRTWLERFISVMTPDHHTLLTLWIAHTHLVRETYTTPRLLLDSPVPESGKTTTLEHLAKLCMNGVLAAEITSGALLTRMIHVEPHTILIDEVDRALDPKRDGTTELLGILNSGYKFGSTRPVLDKVKDGGFVTKKMSTFAPVAMAGNSPLLPADTESRCIRVLLMPDHDDTVEESDWELIEPDAADLHDRLAAWADQNREFVRTNRPVMPEGVKARNRERWAPLKRTAMAYSIEWAETVDRIAAADVEQARLDREDGLVRGKPHIVLLAHLHELFGDRKFIPTELIVADLIARWPNVWSDASPYGRDLTIQRLGRMLTKNFGVRADRDRRSEGEPRGYYRADLEPIWSRMRVNGPN